MNFKTERLEELCELVIDCPHSTPKWTDSGFIVLRNQNIRNGILDLSTPSFTDETDYRARIKRATPQTDDIVFTREAPMGEVCLIPEGLQCCLGQRQVLLRANKKINPHYLFWALQSPYVRHQISWNEGTGTTVSNVRIPVIKDLKIPRFGVIEDYIADVMNSISMKSLTNLKINQTLEEIAQALFKSWFVDFNPVNAKIAALETGGSLDDALLSAMTVISGKDADALAVFAHEHLEQYAELKATAELFTDAMQKSEFGEIPLGWGEEHLGNVTAYLSRGISPKYVESGGLLVLNQKCIRDFRVDASKGRRHDPTQRKVDGREVQVGDVLINSTGVGTLGRVAQVHHLDEVTIVDSHVTVIRAGVKLTTSYLGQYIRWKQPEIEAMGEGSTGQTELSKLKLAEKIILIPPKEVLAKFDKLIYSINSKISANERESQLLTQLRDTLLPKLLAGEITLPKAEAWVAQTDPEEV